MEYKISKEVMDKLELDIAESYINPISIVTEKMSEMVSEQFDNHVMYSVNQKMDINVDKEELIKAMKYDREQYDKGYMDASIKYADLLEENVKLEKALDKACYKLEYFDGYMNPEDAWMDKEWKAWCFKDEL